MPAIGGVEDANGTFHSTRIPADWTRRGNAGRGRSSSPQRPARECDRRGHAGSVRSESHPACVRHRQLQRPGTTWARAGRLHAAGAPCVRSRHPLLRDGRIVRRDAQDAGHRLERHSARQLPAHVEGDDPRRCRSAAEVRRAPPPGKHGILRHHAAPLAAHGDMAGRHGALAGRDPRGPVTEGRAQPWCVGSRTAGPAPGSRKQLARSRDDSREPQQARAWTPRTTRRRVWGTSRKS